MKNFIQLFYQDCLLKFALMGPWYSGDFDTTYEQVLEGCQNYWKVLSKYIKTI